MTTVRDIYEYLDSFAPFSTAMSFDNAGLLAGSGQEPVQKALLALDITPQVVREATAKGAQLVVSHHPVIFDPLRRLVPGSAPFLLAAHGVAAICAHTNLDLAPGGVNTCLAERLGLRNVRTLSVDGPSGLPESLCGELEQELSPREFALFVRDALGCQAVEYTEGSGKVRTAGLCSGAGAFCMPRPEDSGVQAFVTGEAKHHELLAAAESGLTLVAAGHFHTEAVVLEPLRLRLRGQFPQVEFQLAEGSQPPSRYV